MLPTRARFSVTSQVLASPRRLPFYQQLFTIYNGAPGASAATPYNGTTYANAFEGTARTNLAEQLITARVDFRHGANDSFFAHFKWDNGTQPTYVDPINSAFNADSKQPDWEGQLQATHTFSPNLINQFVFSTIWYSAIFVNSNPSAAAALTPYTLSFDDGSFSPIGPDLYNFPEGRNVTQYQFNDDASWTKGKQRSSLERFQARRYNGRRSAVSISIWPGHRIRAGVVLVA